MRDFALLFTQLDQSNKTKSKVEALVRYLENTCDADKLHAIALLIGKRPKRTVSSTLLREWAAELSGIPLWLFEESYHITGDLAETIAYVLPQSVGQKEESTLSFWIEKLQHLAKADEISKKHEILNAWQKLAPEERFAFNKLITGGFRLGVSQKLLVQALSKHTRIAQDTLAHKLMGDWDAFSTNYKQLLWESNEKIDAAKPYPFYLAYPLEDGVNALGLVEHWQIEPKWDGIRGQLIFRNGEMHLWSRGEELITKQFPEFAPLATKGFEMVLDGEIVPFKEEIMPFAMLQKRLGRKQVSKKMLEEIPVRMLCYDLLEWQGQDLRSETLEERRNLLQQVLLQIQEDLLMLSPVFKVENWEEVAKIRDDSRTCKMEGLMLKRLESVYEVGRKKGNWWKWKIEPYTIDAVLIYAMRGHGRRANLYSDYTFAVWHNNELVPFTKAYSGLSDAEMREVDRFVKQHTLNKFGPVRSVVPKLVFELAFEGIQRSSRHKSGIALRFPRIKLWRKDKPAEEANTLEDLEALLASTASEGQLREG
jgi:DNA ligase-1